MGRSFNLKPPATRPSPFRGVRCSGFDSTLGRFPSRVFSATRWTFDDWEGDSDSGGYTVTNEAIRLNRLGWFAHALPSVSRFQVSFDLSEMSEDFLSISLDPAAFGETPSPEVRLNFRGNQINADIRGAPLEHRVAEHPETLTFAPHASALRVTLRRERWFNPSPPQRILRSWIGNSAAIATFTRCRKARGRPFAGSASNDSG